MEQASFLTAAPGLIVAASAEAKYFKKERNIFTISGFNLMKAFFPARFCQVPESSRVWVLCAKICRLIP